MTIVQMRIETDIHRRPAPRTNGLGSRAAISPNSGGNGQSLAGTGALVFEGELLEHITWRPRARVH